MGGKFLKTVVKVLIFAVYVLLILGIIGGVVYLFSSTDDPIIDEPTVDEPSMDNPADDYVAVEQVILNEEGIIF